MRVCMRNTRTYVCGYVHACACACVRVRMHVCEWMRVMRVIMKHDESVHVYELRCARVCVLVKTYVWSRACEHARVRVSVRACACVFEHVLV